MPVEVEIGVVSGADPELRRHERKIDEIDSPVERSDNVTPVRPVAPSPDSNPSPIRRQPIE